MFRKVSFPPSRASLSVEEDAGTLLIPVVRTAGSYGTVSVGYISRGLSATPGLDYVATNGSVMFVEGQQTAVVNVTILDDTQRCEPSYRIEARKFRHDN